jgi:hypothetical protein
LATCRLASLASWSLTINSFFSLNKCLHPLCLCMQPCPAPAAGLVLTGRVTGFIQGGPLVCSHTLQPDLRQAQPVGLFNSLLLEIFLCESTVGWNKSCPWRGDGQYTTSSSLHSNLPYTDIFVEGKNIQEKELCNLMVFTYSHILFFLITLSPLSTSYNNLVSHA